jgi:protein-S-isoprenylcysteine O-methyltransferase Ste14
MIDILSDIIVILCLLALFSAIIINFFESNKNIHKEKRSIVETGSMTGFFMVFYLLLRFKIGHIETSELVLYIIKSFGLLMIILGTFINIKGRKDLGSNWANQVTIYTDQKLITTGIYNHIRHPLYGSIICMFYGACLVYPNYLAFLSNTLIFIPFMYYRAKQEEKLLIERFSDYTNYIIKTGMFFPKLF